ncbi:cellulose binding domain-containing protein [Cesiribacter sp. SM1]|uniref:cellulose binding domain-containing protein n=1 Tax=Cesiribacter sp. SM1 TaxID=2861196 RepID=UPI001CD4DF28|nr:cellulose binding domain-containing protein [Cesiribacter sp. SM1]
MKKFTRWMLLYASVLFTLAASAQSIPGDSVVFGPMFSPVYNDSVRVWVVTTSTGTGDPLNLEVRAGGSGAPLAGTVYNSDDRLGYTLRSFVYGGLAKGEAYTATLLKNGQILDRTAAIINEAEVIDDFSFLAGGCGRIYDTTRCIDLPESRTHKNGDPAIFNQMAKEDSDLMIWLGDATYLLGLQHADGQCPDGIDDWANKDMAFDRYRFYRKFHDSLTMAMPQLAITDNHDTGPNEFNKTMPTLGEMKEIFMDWWPNPHYNRTSEGQGLFSSYRYKDVEFFLLDNRSYRDGTHQHLGAEQLEWLKQGLAKSGATFKVLVNGTPSFGQNVGGRNFAATQQAVELKQFIQENNIDGVLCFSADVHAQELRGTYAGYNYPFFDFLSGNLNSDVGDGMVNINYNAELIISGVKQTYLKVSVFGDPADRRMKVQYVDLTGTPYFESVIHADMLKSIDHDARKLSLSFANSLKDSSLYNIKVQGNITYGPDRKGNSLSAAVFSPGNALQLSSNAALSLHERTFSLGYWVNPSDFGTAGAAVFSNAATGKGMTIGFSAEGNPQYSDHATGKLYTSTVKIPTSRWSHIAWKYDNVKRQLTLFHNGLLTQQWTGVVPPAASDAALLLGSSFEDKAFSGSLDEVALWGKLVADETIKMASEYKPNRGAVLKLSGTQNMAIPGEVLNPALSGDFTIAFWGKLNADPGGNHKILASNSRVNNNTTGLSFEFPDNNKLNVVAGTNGSGWNAITDKGNAWKIGEWNHVAVSATQNGMLIYYVNGEKVGETPFAAYVPNPTGLGLGDSPFYGSEVQAELDELRIWSTALSQDSIKKSMHYPLQGTEDKLAFYYDFSEAASGSIKSKGAIPYEIALNGAEITDGTSPVALVPPAYKETVTANWSAQNTRDNGFYLNDPVANFNSNLVIGKGKGGEILPLYPESDTLYLTTAWLLNPSNMSSGTVNVDPAKLLTNPAAVTGSATHYFLLQGNPADGFNPVSSGAYNGTVVQFFNVPLDSAVYYLAWTGNSEKELVAASFAINAGGDDVEQDANTGVMYTTSSDLELTRDGTSEQIIGLRFTNVTIPQGAVITEAYLQFTVDEVSTTGNVDVVLAVEDRENPLALAGFDYNLSSRLFAYGDTLVWNIEPFAVAGQAGLEQRSPDMSGLLQKIINKENWKAGNAVVVAMADPLLLNLPGYSGNTGKRVAQTYDKSAANAARLVVKYEKPNRYFNGTFPIAKGASWKYEDTGRDLSAANWTAPDYADSSWAWGNAVLGYGDGKETTSLSWGSDANTKHVTYYLRHVFEVENAAQYGSLVFDVLRDDGAVVYVNGKEAFRMNMPEGAVGYNTLATAAVGGSDETTYFRAKTPNLLKDGVNVIAVELHQATASSSDLGFDMEVGFEAPPAGPASFPLAKESQWNYLDQGISLDNTAWKDSTYNDESWASAKGPLGYGDPMNTQISYGPDAGNKFITTYFRRQVMIDTTALADFVQIGLRRDDGALVYINGREVVRSNMPEGAINYLTTSATIVDGAAEREYFVFNVPKTVFSNGLNQLAVEVHNRDGQSSDLGFDLYMKNAPVPNPPADCSGDEIGCFTSIVPTAQTQHMIIPNGHRFQMIFKQGEAYTKGSGTVPGNHDFTAYLPIEGSSELGHLSVNHENSPGGVSILDLHFDSSKLLWVVDTSQQVDFYNNDLVTTSRNCSGGITPWGTIITSEESTNGGDLNGDGYQDVGWHVEIDPITAKVVDYDKDGRQDKLWAMGRMNHENIVVAADGKTAYYGEDGGTHCVYKFVADTPGDLSKGKVFVLSLDRPLLGGDPTGSTARWIQVPNTSQSDRNNLNSLAASLGGTIFNGIEDCEISPVDGKVYFTAKGSNRTYRFSDDGDAVSEFETFVGGMSYDLHTEQGVFTEPWGSGNDNLTFDDQGNLWVQQDGGNNYIWVVRPDHTQSNPKVELFASMPRGSEPTGLTFSPDYRFGFFSIQHPSNTNAPQTDASGNEVVFDKSATVVFALKKNLGAQPKPPVSVIKASVTEGAAPLKVDFDASASADPDSDSLTYSWRFGDGNTGAGSTISHTYTKAGDYAAQLVVTDELGASDTASVTIRVIESNLEVQYKVAKNNRSGDNQLRPHFQLVNTGASAIPYDEITLRYWFTSEGGGNSQNFWCDYAAMGSNRVKGSFQALEEPRQDANHYLELSFSAAGALEAGARSGEIQTRIAKADWSAYNEENDYSYNGAQTTFREWERITVYRNGILVWGTEPEISGPATTSVKVQYAVRKGNKENDNQVQPSFQLVNTGTIAVPYKELSLRYWYTKEGGPAQAFWTDYAALGTTYVSGRFEQLAAPTADADHFLEVSFNAPGVLAAGASSGVLQTRFNKVDWSAYNEANDYSYDSDKTTFTDWERVTLYHHGQLIWGAEPNGAAARIAGSQTGETPDMSADSSELTQGSGWAIYPTLANRELNIHVSAFTGNEIVRIINSMGQEMMQFQLKEAQSTVSIEKLMPGTYVVQLQSPQITAQKQFVKH